MLPPLSTILVSVDRAPESGPPAALRLEPPAAELDRHRVLQLRAVATLPDGSDWDVTDRVTWSSSDPAVARVHSTGLAASLTSGSVELTASWGELHSAPTALSVRP